ncbi:bifunctional phosphoglucose/phosphomannose isomerase [Candidatus Woesearchaeota archaeon]|nr:bifunctional phosphoglucose/phosphomannose isomerase [Candidatus Woesearchaeota archaeon]
MIDVSADSYIALVERFPEHLSEAKSLGSGIRVSGVDKVVIAGMGGSAIAGDLLQIYCSEKAPNLHVHVSRSYEVPAFVDSKTLVFVSSYSGNTEETLSSFKSAMRKGARIVVVSSGGRILKQAGELNKPLVALPEGIQPRAALPYLFLPLLNVMHASGLIPDPSSEISSAISSLKAAAANYKERARSLAEKLVGKVPLIYSSDRFAGIAYRWKSELNENAKVHAFSNFFPELNHNELVGFSKLNANYYAVMIEDEADSRRIKERIKLTKDMIGSKGVPSTQIVIKGEHLLTRILSAVHIGDLASVYLAKLTGVDPEPVAIIEDFKKQLGRVPFV